MLSETPKQIFEAIRRSSSPLLVLPRGAGADGFASALGLGKIIAGMGKSPEIVTADEVYPANLKFLPGIEKIKPAVENLRRLVVEVDTSKTRVQDLKHEEKDGRLFISLTPHQGSWNEKDINVSHSAYRHDLIICLGAPDLEACAHIYHEHKDFFFRTPIINIDHSSNNEHFGQINHVDLTTSAIGETCFEMILAINHKLLNAEVSTAFLTGMIAKTRSFRTPHITPKTLENAGRLIELGAARKEIVKNLFQTRSVQTLRLWGRALARLKSDSESKIVWTLLSQQDFLHAGAHEEDLPDVIDELISNSPEAAIVVLLYENRDRHICGIVRAEHPHNARELTAIFSPSGTKQESHVCFENTTIVETEKKIIEAIKKQTVHATRP
jgi:nanoRNase/pAp phosphatase (c-di-AMP/oligoRNAs hydrolase)